MNATCGRRPTNARSTKIRRSGYDEHLDLAGGIPFFMESLLVVIEDLVRLFILLEEGGDCTYEKL